MRALVLDLPTAGLDRLPKRRRSALIDLGAAELRERIDWPASA